MKKLVFIGGCPRSGTTMLGAMLGSASQHIATPESQFKELLPFTNRVKWDEGLSFERLQKYLEEDFRFRLWDIDIPFFSKKQMSVSEYKEFVLTMVHICPKAKKGRLYLLDRSHAGKSTILQHAFGYFP